VPLFIYYFGFFVLHRSGISLGELCGVWEVDGDSEVGEFCPAMLVEEYISGFEITVCDVVLVAVGEGRDNLTAEVAEPGCRSCGAAFRTADCRLCRDR
jgi:hypothetical protein